MVSAICGRVGMIKYNSIKIYSRNSRNTLILPDQSENMYQTLAIFALVVSNTVHGADCPYNARVANADLFKRDENWQQLYVPDMTCTDYESM